MQNLLHVSANYFVCLLFISVVSQSSQSSRLFPHADRQAVIDLLVWPACQLCNLPAEQQGAIVLVRLSLFQFTLIKSMTKAVKTVAVSETVTVAGEVMVAVAAADSSMRIYRSIRLNGRLLEMLYF